HRFAAMSAQPPLAVSATHRGAPRRTSRLQFLTRRRPGTARTKLPTPEELDARDTAGTATPEIRLYWVIVRGLDVKNPVRNFASPPSRRHKVLTQADGIRRFR